MAIAEASNTRLHKEPAPPKELNPVAPIKQETFKEVLDRNTLNIGTDDFEIAEIDPLGGSVTPHPGDDLLEDPQGPGYEEGGAINPNPWENGDAIWDGSQPVDDDWSLQDATNYVDEYLKTSTIPHSFYEGFESTVPNISEQMEEAMEFTIDEALDAELPWSAHDYDTSISDNSLALHGQDTAESAASSFASAIHGEMLENDVFIQHFLSGQYGWAPGDLANVLGDAVGTFALGGPSEALNPDDDSSLKHNWTYMLENWTAAIREGMDNYSGEWAPFYWGDMGWLPGDTGPSTDNPVFEPADVEFNYSAENMVDLFMNEDWETIYGPFLTNIGISLEDWMEEWGQYLLDYTHQPAQDIREMALRDKDQLMAQMAPIMEQYKVSSGKTGFEDHYSTSIELENLMQQYQNSSNDIDQLAWEQEQQYYDEFMANWISNTFDLTELGAFDICHYNPEWAMCNYELGDDTAIDYWGNFCGDNPDHPMCQDPSTWIEDYDEDDDGNAYDECMDPENYFIDQFGQCHGPCCQNQGDSNYDGDYPEMQPYYDPGADFGYPCDPSVPGDCTFFDQFPNDQRNAFEDIWYAHWFLPDPITGEDSEYLNFTIFGESITEEMWNAMPSGGASGTADDGPGFTSCQGCGNVQADVWNDTINCCPGTYEDCRYHNNCN